MSVLTIVGARPQFIKAAPVSRAIRAHAREIFVHTGQHYDLNMSQVFFDQLELPEPDYRLEIGSGTHGAQTGLMLESIEQVLLKERPDRVLVYGDTNSTLAGALAAVKLHIPVAHVEAGLRSRNRLMPEEINRVLTDHIAELLFAPTEKAVENLLAEGLNRERIHFVGDVMYDAALYFGAKSEAESGILQRLGLQSKEYILATLHRAENTDDPARLNAIFEGITRVAAEIITVMPLHPRTRVALKGRGLLDEAGPGLRLIEPVGYLDMLALEKNSCLVVTDSGGVQKEAYFYRVPCATLRTETEWVELVENGWNHLVPPHSAEEVSCGITAALAARPGQNISLYGEGNAAQQIAARLLKAGG